MAIRVIAVDFWKCNNPSRVSPVDDVHRRMAPRFFPPLLPAFFFNIGFALVFFVFIIFFGEGWRDSIWRPLRAGNEVEITKLTVNEVEITKSAGNCGRRIVWREREREREKKRTPNELLIPK